MNIFPEKINSRVIEFLDHRMVEDTYFLERRVTPVSKHVKNPIIEDCHSAQAVLRDPDGRYRMWYLSRRKIPDHVGPERLYTLRYAESSDGIDWDLPNLGRREFEGSRDNNVILTLGDVDKNGRPLGDKEGIWNFCVIDNQQSAAPNARGRYTALFGDRSFAYSDDGLEWIAYPENPVFDPGGSDTYNNFYFDKRIGRYVLYLRPHPKIRACTWRQANRLVARIESDDLIHWDWDSARCVLDTDARDAPAVSEAKDRRGRDIQFYGMTAAIYNDYYIGMAHTLNEVTGEMDQRLVHSFDSYEWRREIQDTPLIASDPNGWDCGMIGFVSAGSPMLVGEDLYFYYGSMNINHNYGFMGKDKTLKMGLGLGTVKKGRLIGYHAGPEKGELLTRPFELTASKLSLNVDASEGEVTAVLANGDGSPVLDCTADQALPVSQDGLEVPLRWQGKTDLSDMIGKKVRLRIAAENAVLYGISMTDI